MLQLMMFMFMMMFSMIFIQMNHPLAMGLMLLIQTTAVCLSTGMMAKTFWFSYILFLVFMGGMLILFIYVTSLASNEMFTFSMKMSIISLIMLTSTMMIIMVMDNSMMNYMNNLFEMNMNNNITENSLSLNKLYNFPTNVVNLLLVNYLLITLIAIVKITKLSKGPLRMMM